MKEYYDKTHGQAGHGLGTPDVWCWKAITTCVVERINVEALEGSTKEFVVQNRESVAVHVWESTPSSLSKQVQHVYLYRPRKHNPDMCKLEIGVKQQLDPLLELIAAYIVQIGGRSTVGKAPKGEMEREMSRLINDLQKVTINPAAQGEESEESMG